MSKTVDKIRELSKKAAEEKLAEQQKQLEKTVNKDLEVLERILAMVKDRLIYKEVKATYGNKKMYIVVTEEIVLEDYSKRPEHGYGTEVKEVADSYYSYRHTNVKVNGHIYYHASDLIAKYKFEAQKAMEKTEVEYDAAKRRKEAIDNLSDLEPVIKELMLNYQKHGLDQENAS